MQRRPDPVIGNYQIENVELTQTFKITFSCFLKIYFHIRVRESKDPDVDQNPLPGFFLEPNFAKMRLVVELFYVYDVDTAQSRNSKFF